MGKKVRIRKKMQKTDSDEKTQGKYRQGNKCQKGRGDGHKCNTEDIKILPHNLLSVLMCVGVCVKCGVVYVPPTGTICVMIIAISTCQTPNKI